ncbi:hypothetical protein [Siccirubricoccus phaeus]|uniref:hypothetical protein n=1 Tax=Siccirubricoccus phaeus TaxID=2595053 RepID=UPI0011F11D2D|nr:hypothetical protein [Siccirubricoccus phaeus]
MTARDPDIGRLAQFTGVGRLPYRSFHNAPVRRAPPAPPPAEAEPATETATVLTLSPAALSPAQSEGTPVLRVIAGLGGAGAPARPAPGPRPTAESPPEAPFMAPPPAALPIPDPRIGFSLLARAIGQEPPAPPAAPIQASPAQAQAAAPAATRRSFPLLDAALSADGVSSWR